MSKLSGKIAIVTGASKGIGAGIARKLAQLGASVVVNYASSREGADKVVADIRSHGGKAVAVQADTSKKEDVTRLFAETVKAFGAPNVLINNAGVYRFGAFAESSEDDFHYHYNVNVLGTILPTLEALKHFPKSGGSIVNLSSVVSTHPRAGGLIYASTKGAVDNLTRGLALELGERKIRVNAVAPGVTETEGVEKLEEAIGDLKARAVEETPFKRTGQPTDIAETVAFLASDEAGWITGEVIRSAGGLL